jgi:molecular chaperone IbpA
MATINTSIDAKELSKLNRTLIGFDRIANVTLTVMDNSNYPPYNIIKHDDTRYTIEIAVAGFSKEEITVEVNQDRLIIHGAHDTSDSAQVEYLHRGLAARNFDQAFTLAEYITVHSAEVINGLLRINIERIIPESSKSRQITVN